MIMGVLFLLAPPHLSHPPVITYGCTYLARYSQHSGYMYM
eukprot:SAG22_NODE_1294_length_4843_cov_7.543002_3_plen_40_part_00